MYSEEKICGKYFEYWLGEALIGGPLESKQGCLRKHLFTLRCIYAMRGHLQIYSVGVGGGYCNVKYVLWRNPLYHFKPLNFISKKWHTFLGGVIWKLGFQIFKCLSRTTISQDVQTWFSVQLAFSKFLSKIKGNIWGSAVSMILALY